MLLTAWVHLAAVCCAERWAVTRAACSFRRSNSLRSVDAESESVVWTAVSLMLALSPCRSADVEASGSATSPTLASAVVDDADVSVLPRTRVWKCSNIPYMCGQWRYELQETWCNFNGPTSSLLFRLTQNNVHHGCCHTLWNYTLPIFSCNKFGYRQHAAYTTLTKTRITGSQPFVQMFCRKWFLFTLFVLVRFHLHSLLICLVATIESITHRTLTFFRHKKWSLYSFKKTS